MATPETPQELTFFRSAYERYIQRLKGAATQSQLFAQIAPRTEEEQRILQLPVALGGVALQNPAGLAYYMLDYDAIDDPNHPVRPE